MSTFRIALIPVVTLSGLATEPALASEATRTQETITVEGARDRSVNLDDVAFTGSRLGLEIRELPASISVVTQEMIQLTGARTALEAIESAVGMIGSTGVGSIPSYSTRGFGGNDVTVMRDGIRQNTNSQSARPLDSFLFERIEVLKGPASLLYGEGAVGGAVNYVSKTAPDSFKGEVYSSGGQWDTYRAGLGVGGPTGIDDVHYRVDASHSESDGYVDNSGFEYNAFATDLRWDISDRTSVSLAATYLKDDIQSYYGTPLVYDAIIGLDGVQRVQRANTSTDTLVNPRIERTGRRVNHNLEDNFSRAENAFYRLTLQTRPSDDWSLRNETYATTQNLEWRNAESYVWNPATQLVERGSLFLIYRDDLAVGNRADLTWNTTLAGRPNKFLVGALYEDNDQVRNSGQASPALLPPLNVPIGGAAPWYSPDTQFQRTAKVVTTTAAAYIENVFAATDRLQLIGGLRYDSIEVERKALQGPPAVFTKSYSPFTGRVGAVYSFSKDTNVYVSYSRAAQPVSQLVGLTAAQADYSLQKGEQLEAGVKTSLWDQRGELTFAVYDIKKKDLLTSTIIDNVRLNSQIGAQVSQGAELAVSLAPASGWRIEGNLAYTWKAEYEDFNENLGTGIISRSGNESTNVPEILAGLFVVRDWGIWSFIAGVRHVAERWANTNNSIEVDAYTTVDAGVTLRLGNVVATLRGRNLTDELYTSGSSALTPRLDDPRTTELSMRYSF